MDRGEAARQRKRVCVFVCILIPVMDLVLRDYHVHDENS